MNLQVGYSLDLPKLHSLHHYDEKIKMFGTPDNFDTEYTENRHIVDAKQLYRKANKVNYIKQMTKHVQHQMAVELKLQYLEIVSPNPKTVPAQHQCQEGAWVPKCPIHISTVEHNYRVQGLEHGVQAYLHDCSF